MALAAGTTSSGLIRQVQKRSARVAGGAVSHRCSTAAMALTLDERCRADWLAGNVRAGARVHRRQAEGAAQDCAFARVASGASGLPEGTVVEILNDDMPFLVDSVMGELQARGLAVRLLLHPIFKSASATRPATCRTLSAPATRTGATAARKATSPSTSSACRSRRSAISPGASPPSSTEVRVVGGRLAAMLQRLRDAIAAARGGAARRACRRSLRESRRLPALAGAGQLHLPRRARVRARRRRPRPAISMPVEKAGLGVLRNPEVQVLRRGSELVAMTPEIRRFFFAPSPLIITKANVMSRVHRRVHMDYIGIKTYRERRYARGRDPHRRSVHLAGLHALAARDPVPAPQGGDGAEDGRLSARQPRRQGAAQHS